MASPRTAVTQPMHAALDELKSDPSHHFLAVYRRTMGAVNDAIGARRFADLSH